MTSDKPELQKHLHKWCAGEIFAKLHVRLLHRPGSVCAGRADLLGPVRTSSLRRFRIQLQRHVALSF